MGARSRSDRGAARRPRSPQRAPWGVSAALSAFLVAAVAPAHADWEERARREMAREANLEARDLRVVSSTELESGERRFKLLDRRGSMSGIVLSARGRRISDGELAARQARRQRRPTSVFDPSLRDIMRKAPDDERIRVLAWLEDVDVPAPIRATSDERSYEASLEGVRDALERAQQPLVELMSENGGRLLYTAAYAPMTAWEMSVGDLRSVGSRMRGVQLFPDKVSQPRLNVANLVSQTKLVNDRGFTGRGRRMGIVEEGRVASHPNLSPSRRITCSSPNGASARVDSHKTMVAGVMQSNHPTFGGVAPDATLIEGISGSFDDSQIMAAIDCVLVRSPDAVNLSFGHETNGSFDALARFVESTVYTTGTLLVPAASNRCDLRVGSPEIAFNVLAVGGFDDRNTVSSADDVHGCSSPLPFSVFRDPPSPNGDREEPDVVAPGADITMPDTQSGFTPNTGTSFAAPRVTALVSLLAQRDPLLRFQSERVRAIVMASARNNIEGDSRLSDRDGAGAIVASAADGVMIDGLSSFFELPGGPSGFPFDRTFNAQAGERVRVVIAWSQKPSGVGATQPTSDLDLVVMDPSGLTVDASGSFDNSYEIVEFNAPTSGTYTARISSFRTSQGREFIGFAASRLDR